jgi:hypothetical protein
MKNCLAGSGSCVDYRTITIVGMAGVVCDSRRDPKQVAQQGFILLRSLIEGLNVFSGNHE